MTANPDETRGVLNHNPGNIRHKRHWEGLADAQSDPEICTFISAEYGIRAIARILIGFKVDYRCNSVRKAISRWAHSDENNKHSYIAFVARRMNVNASAKIDIAVLKTAYGLVCAIVAFECAGKAYPDVVVVAGLKLAGFYIPPEWNET